VAHAVVGCLFECRPDGGRDHLAPRECRRLSPARQFAKAMCRESEIIRGSPPPPRVMLALPEFGRRSLSRLSSWNSDYAAKRMDFHCGSVVVHPAIDEGTRHEHRPTRTSAALRNRHGELPLLVLVAVGSDYVCQAIVFDDRTINFPVRSNGEVGRGHSMTLSRIVMVWKSAFRIEFQNKPSVTLAFSLYAVMIVCCGFRSRVMASLSQITPDPDC